MRAGHGTLSPKPGAGLTLYYSLAWLLAPLPLFLPLTQWGLLSWLGNSDALFYSNILSLETAALKAGEWFPRWLSDANAGFGSPVMMFYAPLAYVITALINLPFAFLHPGIATQLIVGLYASQVASGAFCYLWLARSFSRSVAFVGSLLFILLPYKLIYIYLHINLAQLWALAFLPLWMIAAEALAAGGRRAIAGYALAFTAVYYTHPLSLIAFALVPALYVLCFSARPLSHSLLRLGAACILGLLLCAPQAIPGQAYIGWIHAERFFGGIYSWRANLGHKDVVLCGYYGLIAAMVCLAMTRVASLRQSVHRPRAFFWLAVLAMVLFLTQAPSAFLYDILTPLRYLQFPAARLHAAALISVIYCICIWFTHHREMARFAPLLYSRAALFILIGFFALLTGLRVARIEIDPSYASQDYLQKGREAKLISTPVALYETQWGCIDAVRAFKLYTSDSVSPAVNVVAGQAVLSELEWHPPRRVAFTAQVRSDTAQLDLRQCYFPLWQATDHAKNPVALAPMRPSGTLGLMLGKGIHEIDITFAVTPAEKLSRLLFVLAFSACAILLRRKPL